MVQVVLRDRMSTSPDCSAVKRSLALSGVNLTLVPSLKTAAATARQKSASMPCQSPLSSGAEKPARPVETPHWMKPLALTSSSVLADAAEAINPSAAAPRMPIAMCFITLRPFSVLQVPLFLRQTLIFFPCERSSHSGPFPEPRIITDAPPPIHELHRRRLFL